MPLPLLFLVRHLYDLPFVILLFSFCHQWFAWLCIYEIFIIIKWHEVNMERICWIHHWIRDVAHHGVMWYGNPLITGMFCVYYWTQQKWNGYTMHTWLYKFILRIGEAVTINSCLYFALLYINVTTNYRPISSVSGLVNQLLDTYRFCCYINKKWNSAWLSFSFYAL